MSTRCAPVALLLFFYRCRWLLSCAVATFVLMACATEPAGDGQSVRSKVEKKKRAGSSSDPSTPPPTSGEEALAGVSASGVKALGQVRKGIATFYDADGSGNCNFPMPAPDLMVVAPNKERHYAGSALCGACMRVTGA